MNTITNLYLISVLVVYVIDLSGFTQSWKQMVRVESMKPFDCSQCMTWWISLIYLWIVGEFTLPLICLSALFAFLTQVTGTLLVTIYDTLVWVMNKLTQFLEK